MTTLTLAPVQTGLVNPYWDSVRADVTQAERSWDRGLYVGNMDNWTPVAGRFSHTSEYAWTVTDPATVAFVAEHCGPLAYDPLAGSGYWAYLLGQSGVDVLTSDLMPPAPDSMNKYHRADTSWVPIVEADAVTACRSWGIGRTLLLSWPPYSEPIGELIVAAHPGDLIVYIGEGDGGCCGDDGMWELLALDWVEVASHRPVQWYGMHDWVTVYRRIQRPALTGGES